MVVYDIIIIYKYFILKSIIMNILKWDLKFQNQSIMKKIYI